MKPLRAVIAEDEPLLRRELKNRLKNNPNIELVAECENGIQAVEACIRLQPELLFLDIVMPGLNGFEVIESLQSDVLPLIIFTTAYDQYAFSAFDVQAVDYLCKPYSVERLCQSIERCELRRTLPPVDLKKNILSVSEHISGDAGRFVTLDEKPNWNSEIIVENRDPRVLIKVDDIVWVDAAGDYMCIHVDGDTHIYRSTMKKLIALLNPKWFRRIHRSTLVNVRYIDKVLPDKKGDYRVELSGGVLLKGSRNYQDSLHDFLIQ
ncbi:MAG: two-component system LytT family response regulator [Flavobacteriales bacterium]|jgi:two-component system LytT family response regulator